VSSCHHQPARHNYIRHNTAQSAPTLPTPQALRQTARPRTRPQTHRLTITGLNNTCVKLMHRSTLCPQNRIPDIIDRNLKKNYQILTFFVTNIPDTTGHRRWVRWQLGRLGPEYSYQRLLKSDNPSVSYNRKCRRSFL